MARSPTRHVSHETLQGAGAAPGPLILIIDNDEQLRRLLRRVLTPGGYHFVEAGSASEGLACAMSRDPRLILLDLGLPDADGFEVLEELQSRSSTPVVAMSEQAPDSHLVRALDAGATDFIWKPFYEWELAARVRVAIRHTEARARLVCPVGRLRVDLGRQRVTLAGEEVRLTPTEYRLLASLARHAGRVMTTGMLIEGTWGPGTVDHAHNLRCHIARLRRKLESGAGSAVYLANEPRVGYLLHARQEQVGGQHGFPDHRT